MLGRGRFGVVREAFDVLLKKKVAIKVLNKTRDKISCQTEVMIYSTLLDRLGLYLRLNAGERLRDLLSVYRRV